MHKDIDVRLTSIFSPTCQTLIHENNYKQFNDTAASSLENSSELLVIRLDNTVIGYASLKSLDDEEQVVDSIYFRDVIKGHELGEYWLTRIVERHLKNSRYSSFLLAS